MNDSTLTLAKAWETLVVPEMDHIADSTLSQYRDDLRLWEKLSPNPPVADIRRDTVMTFREKLIQTASNRGKQKGGKRSLSTVNRIMREIHVVLSPFWPADRSCPGGKGFVPFFAWPRPLSFQRKLPFIFSVKDLDSLYLNADAYRATSGCRSTPMNEGRLWRAALVLALNCGARTFDLFDLRWADIRMDDPEPYKFGSVVFGARKTNKLHRVPLNECAFAHLKDLKFNPVESDEPDRVFPGFKKGKTFYKAWKTICDASKVDGCFESLRKSCHTMHSNISPDVGKWLTGHRCSDVTGYYDNPTLRILEAVYKFEFPPAFKAGMLSLTGAA